MTASSAPAATLAVRLGYGPEDKVLIVHVDDLGLCAAANDGGFEVLVDGVGTSGSLMVPGPSFPEAARLAREHRHLDLGVHLTLNCEFSEGRFGPCAPADAVSTLLDEDGAFLRTPEDTLRCARPEEVERELRAQIETARAAGIAVSHLDAHMGTALYPPFLSIYTALAREFRIPAFAVRPRVERLRARGLEGALPVFQAACGELEDAGLPTFDDFDADSLGFEAGAGESHTRKRLAALQPGVTYWIIHPAAASEGLSGVVGEEAHARAFEHGFYGPDGAAAAWFREAGIATVGVAEVAARF